MRLQRQGHVVTADETVVPERAAFWIDLGLDPPSAETRLRSAIVSLVSVGCVPLDEARAALSIADIRVGESGDLTVVLADDYLRPELADLNRAMLAAGRPWLLVKPLGTVPWIGPLFRPGQTGCWTCLAQRLQANREVESFLQGRGGSTAPYVTSSSAFTATVGAAHHLAALEVAVTLAGAEGRPVDGGVLMLDLLTFETTQHRLTRRPQCQSCGTIRLSPGRAPTPLMLQRQPKRHTLDGGHRVASPEETLAHFQHHVSPISGVVTDLRPIPAPAEAPSIHAYVAQYRAHGQRDTLFYLQRALGTSAGGKGTTELQARVSGLCEGLERHSLQFRTDDIRRTATYRQLGTEAIHPQASLLISEAQYRGRHEWNARGSRYNRLPEPFDEDAPIEWSPVWSLSETRFKYLPTELLYPGYPTSEDGRRYCYADSSGGASGNTLEEAILQGFFELIERDSVSIWWYNRLRQPALDLDSFDEPFIHELRKQYQALGRDLWVLDLTADLPIPTFAAISRVTNGPHEDLLRGFGAHIDPRVAVLRALTEVGQCLLASRPAVARSDGRGTLDPADDRDALAWRRGATLAEQPHLAPSSASPRRRSDYAAHVSDGLLDDVQWCQALVEAQGLELLVLDATRPDVGLPVVRVIVPGLRPVWTRFAAGRLYNVPIQLSWLERPLREDELNPQPYVL
jgi:ribosomal protein S12 methylthiotransferase accessory factor